MEIFNFLIVIFSIDFLVDVRCFLDVFVLFVVFLCIFKEFKFDIDILIFCNDIGFKVFFKVFSNVCGVLFVLGFIGFLIGVFLVMFLKKFIVDGVSMIL